MSAKKSCGPRGRPRGFCPDQATETAMRLFAARGYDGVGVAELSEELGINPPSLYAAFGNKRGLFERALQLYADRFGGGLPDALNSQARLEDAVASVFHAAAEAYTADPDFVGCMVMESTKACHDPDACAIVFQAQNSLRDLLLKRIERARAPEPEVLADFVIATLRGMSASARTGLGRERLQEIGAIAADGFAARVASAGSGPGDASE